MNRKLINRNGLYKKRKYIEKGRNHVDDNQTILLMTP